jgi:salicylate hydroxylase
LGDDYGDKWQSNNRANLRDEFLRLATAPSAELGVEGQPAKIVFDAEVASVDPNMGKVTLRNGDVYESDLVIGMYWSFPAPLLLLIIDIECRCGWH